MALMGWATHVLQWPVQRAATPRGGANLKNRSQFGSQSATRLREAGIASNRISAMTAVNPFPGLVHTARHTMGAGHARNRLLNLRGGRRPR